jgi:membrane-associated phospholipid phosphatase
LRISDAPPPISALILGVAFQMVVLAVLTTRWKASYHAASACALAAVSWTHEPVVLTLALICLALCIGWARVHLGRHTLAQVAAGALTAAPIALLT